MRKIEVSSRFKKDLKTVSKYPSFKKEKLSKYVDMLANKETLPPETKNHKMSKSSPKVYQGTYNFHVAPDICVVYSLDADNVYLLRIGKHNDLNLTETLVS